MASTHMIETMHFVKGLDPVADAFTATATSDVVSMEENQDCLFVVYAGVGTTGTSTITVEACDNFTPSTTSAIAFHYREILSGDTVGTITKATSAGYVTTAGSSKIILVEVSSEDLAASGYPNVRLKMVESVDSPVLGGILIIQGARRYGKAAQATSIA